MIVLRIYTSTALTGIKLSEARRLILKSSGAYTYRTRHIATSIKRTFLRKRAKRTKNKKTLAEKRAASEYQQERAKVRKDALKEIRKGLWESARELARNFPEKDAQQWLREILYSSKLGLNERDPNLWNAFLSSRIEAHNAEGEASCIIHQRCHRKTPNAPSVDPSEPIPAKKVDDWAKELKPVWKAMSQEEKIAITKDAVEKLKEKKEMKKYAKHNVPVAALHDVNAMHARVAELVGTRRPFLHTC